MNEKAFRIRVIFLLVFCIGKVGFSQSHPSQNLKNKAKTALAFCRANNMDTNKCVLIDMSIHSGKNRLMLWDFKSNSIIATGICSHGSCDGNSRSKGSYKIAAFSNVPQSYCSSKGKYKIGARSYSNYGIHVHYKLHGLESTNNNAYKRIIVLHSWSDVPDKEVYPDYAPNSLGCPMVSNSLMKYLDQTLEETSLPVLLWIYKGY